MTIIINRNHSLSTIDGRIIFTRDAWKNVIDFIKQGVASKVIDNDETLMYIVKPLNP